MAKCPNCNKQVTYWTMWDGDAVAQFFMSIGSDQYLKCDKCKGEYKISGETQSKFAMFMVGVVVFLIVIFMFIFPFTEEKLQEFFHTMAVAFIFVGQYIFWRFFIELEPTYNKKNNDN